MHDQTQKPGTFNSSWAYSSNWSHLLSNHTPVPKSFVAACVEHSRRVSPEHHQEMQWPATVGNYSKTETRLFYAHPNLVSHRRQKASQIWPEGS